MSKSFSSSSSSSHLSTPSSAPLFQSGLQASLRLGPEVKSGVASSRSSGSFAVSGAQRWEIRYDELKFDKSPNKKELEKAMKDHILSKGDLVGLYKKFK